MAILLNDSEMAEGALPPSGRCRGDGAQLVEPELAKDVRGYEGMGSCKPPNETKRGGNL